MKQVSRLIMHVERKAPRQPETEAQKPDTKTDMKDETETRLSQEGKTAVNTSDAMVSETPPLDTEGTVETSKAEAARHDRGRVLALSRLLDMRYLQEDGFRKAAGSEPSWDQHRFPGGQVKPIPMSASRKSRDGLTERKKHYKVTEEMRASLVAIWENSEDSSSAFLTFSKAYESMTSESSVERLNNMSQDKINTRQLCYLYQNLFAFAEICYFEEKSLVYALEYLEGSERYAKAALPGRRTLHFDAAAHYILARTYEFLKKPKDAVRHAKKALELYIADDADLLEIRELLYGPQESIPLEKLELGQVWLQTAGIGCIVSCYTLLGRLYLICQDYREAWKQHDKLLAMSGPSHQAQETWRQSRNGSPAVAFSRAWRLASDLFAAKGEFLGARSCVDLVISQMMQQEKFEITGDGHEFLECAEQLHRLLYSKFDQDLQQFEDELVAGSYLDDCSIIIEFVEDTEMQANAEAGKFTFPSCPKLAELLSLPAPASLQAIVRQRKAKTRWWW